MSHAPRTRPAKADSGPLRLDGTLAPPPEDTRPEAKRGPILPAGIEPLLGIDDLAAVLNCSRRLVERMRSAGKVPKPDIQIGKMPRWRVETIRRWIAEGGKP
jgi:hypothetical protein